MKYLIILLLSFFSFSTQAQTKKPVNIAVKKNTPKSYAVVATPTNNKAAKDEQKQPKSPEKRLITIDLDSLTALNNQVIQVQFKTDSTVTIVEYTLNANTMFFNDSISESRGNMYMTIKRIKNAKYEAFKVSEIKQRDAEIEQENKRVQDKIKRREEFRKQN